MKHTKDSNWTANDYVYKPNGELWFVIEDAPHASGSIIQGEVFVIDGEKVVPARFETEIDLEDLIITRKTWTAKVE